DVGRPITRMAPITHLDIHRTRIVVQDDQDHVLLVQGVETPSPTVTPLSMGGTPLALGQIVVSTHEPIWVVDWGPIWIERLNGTSHLYYAKLSDDAPPDIHEVPYPFPDGVSPRFVRDRLRQDVATYREGLLLTDVTPHELLVARLLLDDDGELHV